jgi:hypothetical protein
MNARAGSHCDPILPRLVRRDTLAIQRTLAACVLGQAVFSSCNP